MVGSALVSLLACLSVSAPAPGERAEAWVARYDAPNRTTDRAQAVAVDTDGNVYVTGSSGPTASGPTDYVTVKYDAAGKQAWLARCSPSPRGHAAPTAIAVGGQGESYVTGEKDWEATTVKYDPEGKRAWAVSYSRHTSDPNSVTRPYHVVVDKAGSAYISGVIWYIAPNKRDDRFEFMCVKYDPDGAQLWERRTGVGPEPPDRDPAIALDSKGNVLLAVVSRLYRYDAQGNDVGPPNEDLCGSSPRCALMDLTFDGAGYAYVTGSYTAKYDPDGRLLWSTPLDPIPFMRKIAFDPDGSTVVAGSEIRKYDRAGKLLWTRALEEDESKYYWLMALAVERDGSIYVSGHTALRFFSDPPIEYVTLKFDREGNRVWVARYQGPGGEGNEVAGMVLGGDGKVHVSGSSRGAGFGEDYATVTYDPQGKQLWEARYDRPGSGDDFTSAIAVDQHGNVYVAGKSEVSGPGYVSRVLKYDWSGEQVWTRPYSGVGLAVTPDGNLYLADPSGTTSYDPEGNPLWAAKDGIQGLLALEGSGNVLVTGSAKSADGGADCVTIKYDPKGNQLWADRFRPPVGTWVEPSALAVDRSGNVFLIVSRAVAVKYSPQGRLEWMRGYQVQDDGYFTAQFLGVDCSGNVFVGGSFINLPRVDWNDQIAVLKYDRDGQELWAFKRESPGYAQPTAMAVDCAGNTFVTGSVPGATERRDQLVLKLDPEGKERWARTVPGAILDEASLRRSSLALDASDGVYVTTSVLSRGTGPDAYNYEIATLKYGSDGNELWSARYGPGDSGDASASGLAVDRFGNVYVAGRAWSEGTLNDAIVLKYSTDLTSFIRGDCDGSGRQEITDAVSLLAYLYLGGGEPPCLAACDFDGDLEAAGFLSDAISLLGYLFLGGRPPPPPFPRCESAPPPGALACRTFTSC